jgi:FkbM family methyltransferase
MTYYSQIGQDKYYIEEIAKHRRGGVFLDIGANDGLFGSNTATLELDYGWTGLCIEANPKLIQPLTDNRPNSTIVHKAVWIGPGEVDIEVPLHFKKKDPANQLGRIASLEGNTKSFKKFFDKGIETFKVQSDTATNIINNTLGVPIVIDYMSLDIEGAEIEALQSINFDLIDIRFMTIEHGNRKGMKNVFDDYLKQFGYKVHRVNEWDIEFTK